MKKALKTVLITGASTGIGLELVRLLLEKKNYRVIATARMSSLSRFKEAGLEESENLLLRPLDVCHYEEGSRLIAEIDQKWGGVDILINNAAVIYRSVVEHMNTKDESYHLQVNFLGAMHLIREVLPSMRAKRAGHIINISSVGGMMAMPTMSSYSASKFALEGASESLWYELRPWGIKVTLIQPGFINSAGFMHVQMTEKGKVATQDPHDPYHADYKHMSAFVGKLMMHSPHSAQSVAQRVLKTMERKNPPLRVSGTIDALFFALLRRLMPRSLYHWFLYRNLPHIKEWKPR